MSDRIEVLIYDSTPHAEGDAFTYRTMSVRGVGGSEIEMLQVARALTDRGHKVAIANGAKASFEEDGILYVPNTDIRQYMPSRALYIQRASVPRHPVSLTDSVRMIVRANDVYYPGYHAHLGVLSSGRAALVANTKWQADLFPFAKEKIVIPPMLDPSPAVAKVPGLFVYASGPMKGLDATLAVWRKLHKLHGKVLKKAKLHIVSPGWGDFPTLTPSDKALGVRFVGAPTPAAYREWIAKAEGLFFINTMPETFCCSAALAERSGTRVHILCKNGFGGIPEAITNCSLLTDDETRFIQQFMLAWQSNENRSQWYAKEVPDRTPATLATRWEAALGLPHQEPRVTSPVVIDTSTHGASAPEPHGRAGTHGGHYVNTLLPEHLQSGQWGSAQRYWAHDRILVGGSIIDKQDAARLRALGITHVLSAESERDDSEKWPSESRARFEWTDNGGDVPEETIHRIMSYVDTVLSVPSNALYAHCQMGGSRGPTLAYIALRVALGHEPARAMAAIRAAWAGDNRSKNTQWTPHLRYIQSVERAITSRHGATVDLGLVQKNVEAAYSETPHLHLARRDSLYEAFRNNVSRLAQVDDATASGTWRARCEALSVRAATSSMEDFLTWTEDLYITGIPRNTRHAIDALRMSPEWDRWQRLSRKSVHGGARPADVDNGAAYVTIQHAFHIKTFEESTHRKLRDCDVIFEVGGGFGNFCRVMREDGFRGTHIILDLPHVREVARLFLSLNGVPVTDKVELVDGACLITSDDIEAAIAMVAGKRVAFVATWSLSETPMAIRERLFPALHKDCALYLVASQWDHQWDGIDNRVYFQQFMRDSEAQWKLMPVPGDPEERYLFGVRGVMQDVGDGALKMMERLARTQLGEDMASFERLLSEGRIVLQKSELERYPDPVPPRADGRPTVGLVLIAKGDEAATIIARAIVSTMKVVDAVTVVSDGGQQTVDVCKALGADVHLRPTPKIDYETGQGHITLARNEALSIAERRTDYLLVLDPDDSYEGDLPTELTADAYEIFVYDHGLRYPRVQLFRSGKGYHYRGIIHEQLTFPPGTVMGKISSLKYIRRHGGHQDQVSPEVKYGKHANWLRKWLVDHPEDTRSQFYLAQSYRDSRQYDKAIEEYEKRIAQVGGWDEERAFSATQIARILRDTGKDPTQAFLRAYEMRPTRAEPLYELAMWLRDEKQKRFALAVIVARRASELPLPENDALFLTPDVYQWGALQELAIASYWSGDKAGARKSYEQLMSRVPDEMKQHILNMLALCNS